MQGSTAQLQHVRIQVVLVLALTANHFMPRCQTVILQCSQPYWSNPPFEFFDIRALWRSGLSARVPKCQKIKRVG